MQYNSAIIVFFFAVYDADSSSNYSVDDMVRKQRIWMDLEGT